MSIWPSCILEAISTLIGKYLKLVDQFTYRARSVSSFKSDVNTRLKKVQDAVVRLSIL